MPNKKTPAYPPPQMADIPAPEPPAPPVADDDLPYPDMADDLRAVALAAYDDAIRHGQRRGDAEAAGMRAAKAWAREHNRRMP